LPRHEEIGTRSSEKKERGIYSDRTMEKKGEEERLLRRCSVPPLYKVDLSNNKCLTIEYIPKEEKEKGGVPLHPGRKTRHFPFLQAKEGEDKKKPHNGGKDQLGIS